MTEKKSLTLPSTSNVAELWELSLIAAKSLNWYNDFGQLLTISSKVFKSSYPISQQLSPKSVFLNKERSSSPIQGIFGNVWRHF